MKKSIFSFIIPLALFSLAVFAVVGVPERVGAQVVAACPVNNICVPIGGTLSCPAGYVCTPYTNPQPSNCPNGYTCYDFRPYAAIPLTSASLDSSSPISISVEPGQHDVIFTVVKLTASRSSVNTMNGIQIGSDSVNALNYISNIRVFDGTNQVGNSLSALSYNGNYYYGWLDVSGISIPENASKSLKIIADIRPTALSGQIRLGIAGLNFTSPGSESTGLPVYGSNMTVASSTQPSITVLSPNGGEIVPPATALPVVWTESNVVNPIIIRITDSAGKEFYSGKTSGVVGKNMQTLQPEATNVPPGKYKVTVCYGDGLPFEPCDSSDDYFAIGAAAPCYTFVYNLTLGSRDTPGRRDDVTHLQNFLLAKGFTIKDLTLDDPADKGYFGFATFQALKRYQMSIGIQATGYFGPETRAKVNAECSSNKSYISVLYPQEGDVIAVNQPSGITWGGFWSGTDKFDIYWAIGEKGDLIASNVTQDQAGCSGYGKSVCGYSWTPNWLPVLPLQIVVYKKSSNEKGASGFFRISTSTKPVTEKYDMLVSSPSQSATETWSLSDNRTIKWTYPGELTGKSVVLLVTLTNPQQTASWPLYNASGITPGIYQPLTGEVPWSLVSKWPTGEIPPGQYNILVSAYDASGVIHKGLSAQFNVTAISSPPTASIMSSSRTTSPTPTITGTASGVSAVGLTLSNSGGKVYGSGLLTVTDGKWSTTVSPALAAGQYTVTVYDANNKVLTTGILTVTVPSQPSITVLSPNGGEILKDTDTIMVRWQNNYGPKKVGAYLKNSKSETVYVQDISQILPGSIGTNSFPLDLMKVKSAPDQYKVVICDTDGLPFEPCDSSDSSFTITSSQSTTTTTITVLPWTASTTAGFASVRTGNYLFYNLNWSGGPMGDPNYMIFVHFVNRTTGATFGADFYPTTPVSSWSGSISTPNGTVVPAGTAPGTYDVYVGIYRGATRLALTAGPGVIAENDGGVSLRYKVGSINVTAATATANVSSAGLPLVGTPNASASIWNALKSLLVGQ